MSRNTNKTGLSKIPKENFTNKFVEMTLRQITTGCKRNKTIWKQKNSRNDEWINNMKKI